MDVEDKADCEAGNSSTEVVYSGEALRIVSSWLGGDVNEGLDVEESMPAPRPPGLGLGAKFVPHKKAVALNAGAEKSLEKRIGGMAAPFRGPLRAQQDSDEESEEILPCTSSDEEEASRVAVVLTNPKVGEKRLASEMQTKLLSSRSNSQGQSKPARKKRNRKKKKGKKATGSEDG